MKRFLLPAALAVCALTGCGFGVGYSTYYAPEAPPVPQVETFGMAPGPGYVWINGFWGYSGNRYVWNAGRWARPPHRGRQWQQGEWRHEGKGYKYHQGHWRK